MKVKIMRTVELHRSFCWSL